MNSYIWIFLGIIIALNLAISIFIARRDNFENSQKVIQAIIVWCIPLVGAIGIFLIIRSFEQPIQKAKSDFGDGAIDSGYVSTGGGSENS